MGIVGVAGINQSVYEIVEEGDGENVTMEGTSQCWGLTRVDREKIYIHEGLAIHQKRRTLAHELCHAFLYESANNRARYSQEDVCDIMDTFAERIVLISNRIYDKSGCLSD